MSKAMRTVDLLCCEKTCDNDNESTDAAPKLSFKEEIQEFVNEYKAQTGNVSNSNESLLALNSVLLSKIIDKVDDMDKKLSSV